ncbi:MAG: hypothetical protein WCB27_05825 [Thermoguttaceae bacterium]
MVLKLCFCMMLPGLLCLPFILWRMNLAINHPEKYERLRGWENEETERQKKIVTNIASAGFGIAKRWKR